MDLIVVLFGYADEDDLLLWRRALQEQRSALKEKHTQMQRTFFVVLRGVGLSYLPSLCERGRSSCPVRASYGPGTERNTLCALKAKIWPLQLELRVSHVTSFFLRAPNSSLFCGVHNTHVHLAYCNFCENFGQNQYASPLRIAPLLLLFCATDAHSHFFPLHWLSRHLSFY